MPGISGLVSLGSFNLRCWCGSLFFAPYTSTLHVDVCTQYVYCGDHGGRDQPTPVPSLPVSFQGVLIHPGGLSRQQSADTSGERGREGVTAPGSSSPHRLSSQAASCSCPACSVLPSSSAFCAPGSKASKIGASAAPPVSLPCQVNYAQGVWVLLGAPRMKGDPDTYIPLEVILGLIGYACTFSLCYW